MADCYEEDVRFGDAVGGLLQGDFSRLDPLFITRSPIGGGRSQIVRWYEQGRFGDEQEALAEALTCACFNGRTEAAEHLLAQGLEPSAGASTGMNAFHWAANRGQLEAVRLLLRHKAPLETRSMYGGTVLGTAVWSAIHEPKPAHLQIIEELLDAGAHPEDAGYPSGDQEVDALLRKHGCQRW